MCLKIFRPAPQPITDTERISRNEFLAVLKTYGIEPLRMDAPLDPVLVLETKVELDRIAPSLVYPAEWYVENLWDCENYGMQAANDAGRLFYCSVVLCLGWMEEGYHGFALAMDKGKKVWLLEPNAGFPWAGRWFAPTPPNYDKALKGNKYIPKYVFV